jgi:hypothetical protein
VVAGPPPGAQQPNNAITRRSLLPPMAYVRRGVACQATCSEQAASTTPAACRHMYARSSVAPARLLLALVLGNSRTLTAPADLPSPPTAPAALPPALQSTGDGRHGNCVSGRGDRNAPRPARAERAGERVMRRTRQSHAGAEARGGRRGRGGGACPGCGPGAMRACGGQPQHARRGRPGEAHRAQSGRATQCNSPTPRWLAELELNHEQRTGVW